MNWTELITAQITYTYGVTDKLLDLVADTELAWKPATGDNWLEIGQLLWHLGNACGTGIHGFVTGEWPMPPDCDPANIKPEDMLPPAAKFPRLGSVAEARAALAADRELGLAALARCSEERLDTEPAPAPWDPTPMPLGPRLLTMVAHLTQHKGQLFYYLKLQGKPVNTHHLWGM